MAFGRARGVIVWPEVDFPMHDGSILESIPELGCLSADGKYRQFIDPLFPGLWPTLEKIWGFLNDIFPPEYPFHSTFKFAHAPPPPPPNRAQKMRQRRRKHPNTQP